MRAIALAAITLAALLLTGSDARADGPWCAYYRSRRHELRFLFV